MQKYKEALLYLFFISIGLIYGLIRLRPEIIGIYHIEKGMREKKAESVDLSRQLQAIKATEMEKANTSLQMKNIYKPGDAGLDAESSFTVVFDDIIDMAKYNGIKIYSIEYVYNPPDDEFVKGAADKYNVCQLNMAVVADYLDLEGFLKELYKYPYLINVSKLELAPYAKNKKIILSNIQIKLYSLKT